MQEYLDTFFPGPILMNKIAFSTKDRDNDGTSTPLKREPMVYFLNPFHLSNAAFMMSYFNVGVGMNFLNIPVSFYLITTLGISATQYSAYVALIGIPWSLKFIFGMISDGTPILKYRRKSWFTIGWTCFVAINLFLAFDGPPSVDIVIVSMFFMTCSYLLADVSTDTIAVERSRYENDTIRGCLQTSAYTIRSFGAVIGALLGALLYNTRTWGWGLTINQCFLMSALIPLVTIAPVVVSLEELVTSNRVPTVLQQFQEIWRLLQLKAVYRTVGYIFFYGVFQVQNGAWATFLLKGLKFTDFQYGILNVFGAILAYFGIVIYRQYFFETSWRNIYIYTTILGSGFSLLQIILILQYNQLIGIPNFYFALGDTAAGAVISAIQFMPSCIMFAMLCPEGSEGVSYAFLTTISNLTGSVAADIGSAFTLIWDVSNDT
jgi:MFS family permease